MFENIGFTLLNDVVKLLLTFKLVDFKLPFELLLLFDLLFCSLQITLQVEEEVRLLYQFKTFLKFVMLLHKVGDGLVSNHDLTLCNGSTQASYG